jgi:hypothetical protein
VARAGKNSSTPKWPPQPSEEELQRARRAIDRALREPSELIALLKKQTAERDLGPKVRACFVAMKQIFPDGIPPGTSNKALARKLGFSRQTVGRARQRFAQR